MNSYHPGCFVCAKPNHTVQPPLQPILHITHKHPNDPNTQGTLGTTTLAIPHSGFHIHFEHHTKIEVAPWPRADMTSPPHKHRGQEPTRFPTHTNSREPVSNTEPPFPKNTQTTKKVGFLPKCVAQPCTQSVPR